MKKELNVPEDMFVVVFIVVVVVGEVVVAVEVMEAEKKLMDF